MKIEIVLNIISIVFISIGIFLLLVRMWKAKYCDNQPVAKTEGHHFAILIPARDESKVIEELLKSIKKQTVPILMKDVYVIVESEEDPTVKITTSYKASTIIRVELDKRRKGFALDEAIRMIKKQNKRYDAYFIFDADNILESDYLEKMTKSYDQGYDIGVGYRNCKNGNDSWVAACSSLTFSMINTLGNESKKKKTQTVTISGTGFYIRGNLIDKWGGYPFHTLTEDYELTLYATLHGLTTDYNIEAKFYDEQPLTYRKTVPQRIRWVRGYFDSRRIYVPQIKESLKHKTNNYGSEFATYLGVKPFIIIIIGIVLFLLNQVIKLCYLPTINIVITIFGAIIFCYLLLFLITLLMLKKEKGRLNLTKKMQLTAVVMNPFFLTTYVYCAIVALIHHDIEWKKIEHSQTLKK